MKQKIVIFIISISISISSKAQTSLHDSLLSINYSRYLNMPIDSLLSNIPQSYDSLKIAPDNTMFYGASLLIIYLNRTILPPKEYVITVWPSTHNYITRENPQNLPWAQAWPFALLKKENIGAIDIMDPDGKIMVDVHIE